MILNRKFFIVVSLLLAGYVMQDARGVVRRSLKPGVKTRAMQKWIKEQGQCVICLEDLYNDSVANGLGIIPIWCETKSNASSSRIHMFHTQCLLLWRQTEEARMCQYACPECRHSYILPGEGGNPLWQENIIQRHVIDNEQIYLPRYPGYPADFDERLDYYQYAAARFVWGLFKKGILFVADTLGFFDAFEGLTLP